MATVFQAGCPSAEGHVLSRHCPHGSHQPHVATCTQKGRGAMRTTFLIFFPFHKLKFK